MTEVITAAHDTHEAAHLGRMQSLGKNISVGFGIGEFDIDGFLPQFALRNQVGQRKISIRSCHQIHMVVGNQVILYPLGHTAKNTYD